MIQSDGFSRLPEGFRAVLERSLAQLPPDQRILRQQRISSTLDRLYERQRETGLPLWQCVDDPPQSYECRCHRTGILLVRYWNEEGQVRSEEMVDCPDCDAGRRQVEHRQSRYVRGSGLEDFGAITFESIKPTNAQVNAGWTYVQDWASGPDGWLWLYGQPWTGKTHAAICVGNWWLSQGHPVLFYVEPELMDDLRATLDRGQKVSYSDRLTAVKEAPLLIIDDWGKAVSKPNPDTGESWVDEVRYKISDYRVKHGLVTLVTSNLSQEDIRRRFPRLAPRIFDSVGAQTVAFPDIPYKAQLQRDVDVAAQAARDAPKSAGRATQSSLAGETSDGGPS